MPLLTQGENEELTAVPTAAAVEIFHLSKHMCPRSLTGAFEKGINQSMCKHPAADKPPGYR